MDEKTKKKVLYMIIILFILGSVATTATYAWFTSNSKIELGEIDIRVRSSNGMQVSTDAVNWKSNLTTAELQAASYNGSRTQFPTILTPVSTVGSTTAGIYDIFYGNVNEDGFITLTKEIDIQGNNEGNYIAFDIFIQASSDLNVGLLSTSDVDVVDNGVDSGLKYSTRVGFLNKGTDATSTPATAYQLNRSEGYTIWEPNADNHTTISGGTNGTVYSYAGAVGTCVSCNINDSTYFRNISNDNIIVTNTAKTAFARGGETRGWTGTPWNSTSISNYPTMFSVSSGITKIRIYIWIEGQDIDCENSASHGSGVKVVLALNAANTQ